MNRRLTLPNILTSLRVALTLLAGWLVLESRALPAAVVLLTAAAVLDAVDGWVARAFAHCSRLGTHIDPLADKVLITVVFAWVGADADSPWVWSLIGAAMAREVGVTVLRFHCGRCYGRIVPSSSLGRWKMFMQSSSGLLVLSSTHVFGRPVPVWVVVASLLAALAVSAASAAGYLRAWRRMRVLAAAAALPTLHTHVERVASGG